MDKEQLITDERRLDLLTGAIEGGSNGWYFIRSETCIQIYNVSECSRNLPLVECMFKAIRAGMSIPIYDIEEKDNKLGEINLESIEKGEALMVATHPDHYDDILEENDDAGTADVWFQFCVMNELVYG